jgi:U3 small nucleolar ribonucleoprotein protein IMP4
MPTWPSANEVKTAYEIRQGTIEQTEAEREWVLAHYARTSKKRSLLSGSATSYGKPTDPNLNSKPVKRAKR